MTLQPLLSAEHFPSLLLLLFLLPLILTPGRCMLLFLNCLQLLLSCALPHLPLPPPLPPSLLLRWWECRLLRDSARGEPNIFPLLAFPGVAVLEQHGTVGFFFFFLSQKFSDFPSPSNILEARGLFLFLRV